MTKTRKKPKRKRAEVLESGLLLLSDADIRRIADNIRENNAKDMISFLKERNHIR